MAEPENADPKQEEPTAPPSQYGDKVLAATQWALGGLGAVAATALGKVALDRLENGDYADGRALLAFVSAALFAVGIVALIAGVIATTTESAVGFSWLINAKKPEHHSVWRWVNRVFLGRDPHLAWEVASAMTTGGYLVPGATTGTDKTPPEILRSFTDELSRLVKAQYNNPSTFGSPEYEQLQILAGARDTLLEAARRARLQQVSRGMPVRFLFGSLLAVLGAVGFAFATSQAQREAAAIDRQTEKRSERVVTGELLPKSPSIVRVLFPESLPDLSQQRGLLSVDQKSSCDLASVDAVLVAVGTPPNGNPPGNVMRVVTLASDACNDAELWLPPERVVPPPTADGQMTEGEEEPAEDAQGEEEDPAPAANDGQ